MTTREEKQIGDMLTPRRGVIKAIYFDMKIQVVAIAVELNLSQRHTKRYLGISNVSSLYFNLLITDSGPEIT